MFSQIPGLHEIKDTLIQSVANNHVAHAQLFAGTEGSGGLAMALAFATFINCENRLENDACGECNSCRKCNKLIHPDLHFTFPVTTTKNVHKEPSASQLMNEWRTFCQEHIYGTIQEWLDVLGVENKQLNIPVHEGRSIISNLSLKPFEGFYKIQIIWLPEYMNQQMANSILKVLEEPTEKTLFLLVTQNYEKLLTTIISRCQMINIRAFSDEEITNYLIDTYQADEMQAKQIAFIAEGNLNRALQLLNNVEDDHQEFFRQWMLNCYYKKFDDLLAISDQFHNAGREGQKSIFQYGLNILREVMMYKTAGEQMVKLAEKEKTFVKKFSKTINIENIQLVTDLINEAIYHVERNGYGKIVFFDTSVKISRNF